jgi:hypothetical protein
LSFTFLSNTCARPSDYPTLGSEPRPPAAWPQNPPNTCSPVKENNRIVIVISWIRASWPHNPLNPCSPAKENNRIVVIISWIKVSASCLMASKSSENFQACENRIVVSAISWIRASASWPQNPPNTCSPVKENRIVVVISCIRASASWPQNPLNPC